MAGTASPEQTWPIALMFSARFWSWLLLLQNRFKLTWVILDLEKSINLVLSGWRTSLLTRKNLQIFRNSTSAISISLLMFVWVKSRVVSSANNNERNLEDKGRSFMYKINNKGPKIEPCGTPSVMFNRGLELLFMLRNCLRSVKYELNHVSSVSARPYIFLVWVREFDGCMCQMLFLSRKIFRLCVCCCLENHQFYLENVPSDEL